MNKCCAQAVKEHNKRHNKMCEERILKAFSDGAHTTGEQAKEIHAIEMEEQRQAIIKKLKGMKKELPKKKCINAEMHLFDRCFSCEKIKGYNQAINDMINEIKSIRPTKE